ncbi:MAG: non-homologous end-joining DNA ligase [Actinomycetota bacterium]|nr:non-homologous end-joining DNA ligase [Actinomycetota bacterium]
MTPSARGEAVEFAIGERTLKLTNLDKALYPTGFTKSEIIEYYARISPVMVPHLAGRCITLKRFPDGSDTAGFFQKQCPTARPDWVDVAEGPGDRRGGIFYCRLEEPAALVWTANLAALELHAPMALSDDLATPRAIVFDLDPGAPAGIRECCEVALAVREVLAAAQLEGYVKTSGSKGMQLYVPLNSSPRAKHPPTHEDAADFALAMAQVVERQLPGRTTTVMAKAQRPGKIFIDYSQNAFHKTTIAPYSLRARDEPTASTPLTWDEVEAGAAGDLELRFEADAVLARVDADGDHFAGVLTTRQNISALGT